jgi:hypothetical protein
VALRNALGGRNFTLAKAGLIRAIRATIVDRRLLFKTAKIANVKDMDSITESKLK